MAALAFVHSVSGSFDVTALRYCGLCYCVVR